MSYATKREGVSGGLRIVNPSAPRPWRVSWSEDRGYYLKADDGRVVAYGFARFWKALTWAAGK